MLNNFSSKCIKMAKQCAFGTSYGIIQIKTVVFLIISRSSRKIRDIIQ